MQIVVFIFISALEFCSAWSMFFPVYAHGVPLTGCQTDNETDAGVVYFKNALEACHANCSLVVREDWHTVVSEVVFLGRAKRMDRVCLFSILFGGVIETTKKT